MHPSWLDRQFGCPISHMGTSVRMSGAESSRTPRHAPAPPDLAPQRDRPLELDPDLGPPSALPVRVQYHAQDAVDAETGRADAGVGVYHFPFGPRGSPYADHVGQPVDGFSPPRNRARMLRR